MMGRRIKGASLGLMIAALCLCISALSFGQSVNATVGGTVVDPSGALIPGVTVTATNTGTGIMNTVVTNESGAYNFAALQPGAYKVTAELPGFQTQTFTDVQLGGAQQVTLNFTLQVSAAAGTNVEVTIAADTVLATTSNSIGAILPEYRLRDLPAQTGNVFNLVQNLPGVLVNPQPGGRGTLGFSTVRGPSFFDLDLNLVKRFRITETKQFELRLDVINALNHPNFAAPTLNINGAAGTFGQITSLAAGTNVGGNGGMRSFLLNTRVNF